MAQPQSQKTRLVFAVDLGGTHLRTAAIDKEGNIHNRTKSSTTHSTEPDNIVRAIVEAERACEEKVTDWGVIDSTCVAVPGTVNSKTGVVLTAPNVPSLSNFTLAEVLQAELDQSVLIENDANAAAMGEFWKGAARDVRTMVCITLGTGVGGGIILDGELWRGVDGSAGEVGHITIEPHGGVACGCGSEGCLEVYASATALVRMANESLGRNPQSPLNGVNDLTSEKIFEAAQRGDDLAIDVFKRMGAYLGIGMANLVNILNPEMIVIAGGVANAWSLFNERAVEEMRHRAFPLPSSRVQIKRAECADNAGLLGAASLAFVRFV